MGCGQANEQSIKNDVKGPQTSTSGTAKTRDHNQTGSSGKSHHSKSKKINQQTNQDYVLIIDNSQSRKITLEEYFPIHQNQTIFAYTTRIKEIENFQENPISKFEYSQYNEYLLLRS